MKRVLVFFPVLLLSFTCLKSVFSQGFDSEKPIHRYSLTQWTIESGLPSGTITTVYRSADGYLWLGGFDGATRYDGYRFKTFDKTNTDVFDVCAVSAFSETPDGRLWIATASDGLIFYINGQFERVRPDFNPSMETLFTDSKGRLFIGTRNKGVFCYDSEKDEFIKLPLPKPLQNANVSSLTEDASGNIWLGLRETGLYVFRNNAFEEVPTLSSTENSKTDIRKVYSDPTDGSLWVGTSEGLYRYFNDKFKKVPEVGKASVTGLLTDEKKNLWVSSFSGVFKRSRKNQKWEQLNTENGLPHNQVRDIYPDHEGNIWIAAYRAGLFRINDGLFINYAQKDGLRGETVSIIKEQEDGSVLVSDDKGYITRIKDDSLSHFFYNKNSRIYDIIRADDGTYFVSGYAGIHMIQPNGKVNVLNKETGLPSDAIRVMLKTQSGSIWAGSRNRGLFKLSEKGKLLEVFDKNSGLKDNFVMSLEELKSGLLLVGTNTGGLHFINPQTKKITTIGKKDGLTSDLVFNTYEDAKGVIWVTSNNGVSKIAKDGKIKTFSSSDGMPANSVFDILEDNDGNYWFSSSKGIIKLYAESLQKWEKGEAKHLLTELYTSADGLKNRECTGATASTKTSDGRLWFPMFQGAAVVDPSYQNNIISDIPARIETIQSGDLLLNFDGKQITLSPDNRERVRITFTGLDLRSPSKLRFRYRLNNFDKDWVISDEKREATYTNLSPGNYTFEVQVGRGNKWIGNKAEVKLYVESRFYETRFFYLGLVLLVFLLLAGTYRLRVNRAKAVRAKLERIVASRTSEVLQQNKEISAQRDRIESQRAELEKSHNNISVVSKIGRRVTTVLDFNVLNKVVHGNISSLIPADGFGIGKFNTDEKQVEFRSYIEKGKILPYHSEKLDEENHTFATYCLTSGEEIFINDLEKEYNLYIKEINVEHGDLPKSLIYLPLNLDGQTVGVLTVQSFKKNAYSKQDLELLRAVSTYVSVALSNAAAYNIIHEKNINITAGIRYARTIQQALLPTRQKFSQFFQEHFIIYKPKDIVSGDFFWTASVRDMHFAACVDCTGHGVPGALMSMIGIALLNEIVNVEEITEPHEMLHKLHDEIRVALKQDQDKNDDGMDIGLCRVKALENKQVEVAFSGAKNSLFYAGKDESIREIKGTRRSVGGVRSNTTKRKFTTQTLLAQRGDYLYMASDGFTDQHNSEKKKFGKKLMLSLLEKVRSDPTAIQHKAIEGYLDVYMDTMPQRDDITFIGLRL